MTVTGLQKRKKSEVHYVLSFVFYLTLELFL